MRYRFFVVVCSLVRNEVVVNTRKKCFFLYHESDAVDMGDVYTNRQQIKQVKPRQNLIDRMMALSKLHHGRDTRAPS